MMWTYLLILFAIAFFSSALPLLKPWNPRQLHLFIAFGAGVFLGAVFLHILPEISHESGSRLPDLMVLAGFLGVLLIERVLFSQHERHCGHHCGHGHEVVGYSTFIGLAVHALAEGLSLGLVLNNLTLAFPLFLAICSHKWIEAFSLTSVLQLAHLKKSSTWLLALGFAAAAPVAAVFGHFMAHAVPLSLLPAMEGLAGGTFLYVATCDLLPEAFHEGRGRVAPFICLSVGVAVMFGLGMLWH